MKPTLGEAIVAAFGEAARPGNTSGQTPGQQGPTGQPTGPTTGGGGLSSEAQSLIAQANRQFEASQRALRAGDFAEYGRQVEALKATLRQLQALQQ